MIKEGDLVLVNTSLSSIPNTSQAGVKNEIVRVIRNDTEGRIGNIYKEWTAELAKAEGKTEGVG